MLACVKRSFRPVDEISTSTSTSRITQLTMASGFRTIVHAAAADLGISGSWYLALFRQVFTARLEANDNMKYLRTLEDWFDKLNDDGDFPKLLEVRLTVGGVSAK